MTTTMKKLTAISTLIVITAFVFLQIQLKLSMLLAKIMSFLISLSKLKQEIKLKSENFFGISVRIVIALSLWSIIGYKQ